MQGDKKPLKNNLAKGVLQTVDFQVFIKSPFD